MGQGRNRRVSIILAQVIHLAMAQPGRNQTSNTVENFLEDIQYSKFFGVENVGGKDYCFSKECIQTAAEVLDKMDQAVDPCQDFYQFACGGYVKKTVISEDKTKASLFSDVGYKLNQQLRGLFEETIISTDAKPFHLVKTLYQSCMDKETVEERGTAPLLRALHALGGWPVLERGEWVKDGFKWYDVVYRLRQMGYSADYFVDLSVVTNIKNSSWRALSLDQPRLGLPREYLMKGLEDNDVQAYLTFMKEVAMLLGADQKEAEIQMLETLEFELKLANISLPREERRNVSAQYNPMPISQLSQLDPNTPWLDYITTVMSEDSVVVEEFEIVNIQVPSYIRDLSLLIGSTPARVQANYLAWRAASGSVSNLNKEVRELHLKFSKSVSGKKGLPPRWRKCVTATTKSLPNAVGSLYVRKYFDEDSRKIALNLVREIKKQFEIILDENTWMDEVTKQKAILKSQAIAAHIGYPPELLDMDKLEHLYDGLELRQDDYFGNKLRINIHRTDYHFSKLRQMVDKNDWVRHGRPAVVNAFYSPLENSISFPAGILQGGFFNKGRPLYMNYGAIGWVIGHEITHGFDDQGRQFDQDGNLVDWWGPQAKERYLSKASCIIQQYGNYTPRELGNTHLNGINTQGENIADNGGIKEAYRAYTSWTNRHGPSPLLPGLAYSQSQLFWISAANVWCAKYRPKALKLAVLTGAHSPSMFRVQGTFSNMDEFSRDFNCPVGSNMNPRKEEKCQVW